MMQQQARKNRERGIVRAKTVLEVLNAEHADGEMSLLNRI